MSRPVRTLALVLVILAAAGLIVTSFSNALRKTGSARFAFSGTRTDGRTENLNRLEMFGPWGCYCITYGVTVGPDGSRQLAGRGITVFPLVGPAAEKSSAFPPSGEITGIEPGKDTLIYKSAGYEYHLILSRERDVYESLGKGLSESIITFPPSCRLLPAPGNLP